MKLAFLRVRAEQVFKIHHKSCFQHTVSLALALINNFDSAPQSKGTNPQLMHKHFLPLQSFACFFFPLSFQKEFWMVNSTVLVRKTPLHFRLFFLHCLSGFSAGELRLLQIRVYFAKRDVLSAEKCTDTTAGAEVLQTGD